MNFFRRLFGVSENTTSDAPRNDVISITDDAGESTLPPEPVIEAPEAHDKPKHDRETPQDQGAKAPDLEDTSDAPVIMGTRQLPPLETFEPKPGDRILFGQLSDIGMVRGNNQDAVLNLTCVSTSSDNLPECALFVVADGMGGHHDGEKASAMTARIVSQYVMQEIFQPLLGQQMDDPDRTPITETLRAAVQKANEAVGKHIPEGGTTVTCAVILDELAYFAHVGDSRAYLLTKDSIEQITRDHSLVQRLIELDQLTPAEAAEHPQRNVLYRAIGQNENLDVDAVTRRLPPGARLLLCSDGLWNMVSEETIRSVVMDHDDPQDACHQLVHLANERGGPDNITVVLIQMPG